MNGLDLTIEPGEHVAIVGPSGSSKSTLARLLLGFIQADSGQLSIGEQPLTPDTITAWRRRISWIPQKPRLFHGSIIDNIRLGMPDATREEVLDACEKAYVLEFVERLPQGLDTRVGEGGQGLSGGQLQRIAIARALVRDTPWLLVDEPSAHLDAESEHIVTDALASLEAGRTLIGIAHHLQTVRNADRIVVLRHGRMVQQGPWEQLSRTRIEPLAPTGLAAWRSGELLNRLQRDIDRLDAVYLRIALPLLVAAIGILLFTLFMALLNLGFLLFGGVTLPLWINRLSRDPGRHQVQLESEPRTCAVDTIQGMAELTAYGADGAHARRFRETAEQWLAAQDRLQSTQSLGDAAQGLLAQLAVWPACMPGLRCFLNRTLSAVHPGCGIACCGNGMRRWQVRAFPARMRTRSKAACVMAVRPCWGMVRRCCMAI